MIGTKFDALEELPYLSVTNFNEEPLEKELSDRKTLIGLRQISNNLIKNNPAAACFLLAYLNAFMGGKVSFNVVGPEYFSKPLEKILSKEFEGLDINRQYDINMICEYLITGAFSNGDILIHTPSDKDRGDITTMVELIEANRIVTPRDKLNNSLVRNGVQYSKGGKILGYYVKPIQSMHEVSLLNKQDFDFIPLYSKMYGGFRQNCMMFKSPLFDQCGTARNFPCLIPSSKVLRYLLQYVKSVVIGAHVGACFSAFIKTDNPAGAKKDMEAAMPTLKQIGKVNPGGIYFLRRGEDITFGSPSRPADNTDTFIKRLCIFASSSIVLPYETTFLHLENTSFSSWKGGTNAVEANRNRWLNRLNKAVIFIAKNITQELIVKNMVRANFNKINYSIRFPRFDPLDSEKKARGDKLNLTNETTSRQRVCKERNIDFEELEAELLKEGLIRLKRQAELVVVKKETELELDIILPEDSPTQREKDNESDDISEKNTQKRKGEGEELTEEDKIERRKTDGNF